MKRSGIFFKIFIYTIIFSVLLASVTTMLLWTQVQSYYSRVRFQEATSSYQSIVIDSQGNDDIMKIARKFYENNQSLQFYIKDINGNIVYATPEAEASGIESGEPPYHHSIMLRLDNDYLLCALSDDLLALDYNNWIGRGIIILLVILAVCVLSAFVFAKQMTKPIKILVDNTNKMANLEKVPPAPERKDELGTLTRDVYSMYHKLKETISRLEDEILRERELEETQRYFFSAASHELKTPIAATSILLEGMLEDIGNYKDHPKYLRECVKMMDRQSKIISEILEIVSLNDGKIELIPIKLDIKEIIAQILPDFQTLAATNKQHIIVNIPTGQLCFTDSKMLHKVLVNIILNAVQNTPTDGTIQIWSEPVNNHYRLCVLNKGAQIDDTVLLKLFEPFYRVDQARNRKNGRSGLGLAIVQKTLTAMSINFALENNSEGVLFWLDLPQA